jgi:hypothetical protein
VIITPPFIDHSKQQEFYNRAEKVILAEIRDKFDTNFREKNFVNSLSEFIESYCNLAKTTGAGQLFQKMFNATAFWNNEYVEPVREIMYRTPSHKIHSENKYSLFHYYLPHENDATQRGESEERTIDNKFSDTSQSSNQYSPPADSTSPVNHLCFYQRKLHT